MCSVGHKSVLPNRNRQMTYMHRGNCRSSVCRSKGGRPQVVQVVGGPGGPGGPSGQGGVSGHLTYRHLTYTGVCRSYVRFVQKKQTYDLQTPVILVMNSVGVMSICEVLSRLKSLKKLPPLSPLTD